ncbi:MAG: gliding motility-associated C-terminal domain-containing protein, partial [Bacteroidota bacterium]
TAPYTYYWSQASVTDTISDLLPGTYYLTITDDHMCTYLDSAIIGEPTLLEFTVDITDVSCNGFSDGEATALPTGGIGPYTYIWSNGDTTVTSAGLPANTYFVTVYDNNLCSAIDSIKIQQPTQLVDSMSSVEVTCYGFSDGEATVFASGGTPPYFYDWSTTDTISSISGLFAGWYYITVTDTNNCVITDSIEVLQPPLLVVADSVWDVLCYGESTGIIFMDVTGGTPPYTYTWFDGSSGSIHDSLPEGKYHVSVTDANGCFHLETNIVVNQPFDLVISMNFISPLCFGYADGSISTTVSGGVLPYQYYWSDSSTNANHTGTTAGFYGVTVTDDNGCTERDTITVTEPDLLVILDSTYIFQYEGFIDLDITGGTFPYEYDWSNEETTEDLTGLISGTYQVTVTDFNGCLAEGEYIIDIPFVIPSLFTPNGDGYNDTWEITNLKAYGDLSIQIYNRWGDLVYEFEGSGFEYDDNRWDGTYNSSKLPMGSYVYIIDLKNGNTPYSGTVMLKY